MPNNRHRLHANAIRALSMDAVEQAASGHPGAPMGMADMAEVLFNRFLRHNPNNPQWPNRDRFVLSNGHGSLLIYTALHLSGYALSLSDLRQFRQLHSKTPGHPEYGETPGIETTTGPLGQGLANAVGMALAERNLAHTFNREGLPLVDHYSYVFAGDGCLMEGLSHEAASLAGTLGLGKLIVLYDDNQISIDGRVDGWFTDNSAQRFAAYGWHVVEGVDGHDADAVEGAIKQAQAQSNQPSIICCRTTIGFGAPNKQDTAASHGAPLGADEIAAARQQLGWKWPPFVVPEEVYKHWDARQKGAQAEDEWQQIEADYRRQHPQLAAEFERRCQRQLPADWPEFSQQLLRDTDAAGESPASRKASHVVISAVAPQLPELLGGSADLTGSNLTRCSAAQDILPGMPAQGDYIYYGVREFGMSAIMNGISLHGGFRPYGGTFLVFSDYARNALRMSALMKQPVIYVYTHDSIGLGEDGPTHQPVEHLACLRLIPGLSLWRPGDATETVAAWIAAIERQDGPTCLVLSRQALAAQQRDAATLAQVGRGGYVLQACSNPDAVVIATGSELELARAAIAQSRRQIQLVSMPCTDRFDAQPAAYRDSVLPTGVPRIAIEAGNSDYWRRYVGLEGDVVGIDSFGASAPAEVLFPHFGFTADNLLTTVENTLAKGK